MYISETDALNYAVEILKTLENTAFHQAVIDRLATISKRTRSPWSNENIRKSIESWTYKHGNPPTHKDFGSDGLPFPATVKRISEKTPTELVKEIYPDFKKEKAGKYPYESKEDWLNAFRSEYNRIQPESAVAFNIQKSDAIPTWFTIARKCGFTRWRDLVTASGVKTSNLKTKALYSTCTLVLNSSSSAIDQLREINDHREKLNQELRNITSKL